MLRIVGVLDLWNLDKKTVAGKTDAEIIQEFLAQFMDTAEFKLERVEDRP